MLAFQDLVRRVPVPDHLYEFAVDLVRRPHAEIALAFTGDRVGGLALSLLSLAASRGTRLRIRAVGPDAQAALEALGRILEEPHTPTPA